jgi:D-glycero-D-manno-heptose 1,7-bisphosphate phosphatase
MGKAAFLDRDGVINRKASEGEYITRWEDFQFLPRVAEGIALLNRAGLAVIVVSNQRCVAKGLLSIAELELIHQRMVEQLAASNAFLTGIYYCPHDNHLSCSCRKPAPGMLLQAACEHAIDLTNSWILWARWARPTRPAQTGLQHFHYRFQTCPSSVLAIPSYWILACAGRLSPARVPCTLVFHLV